MAAWLNFFLFVGFLTWVRILVGLLALFFAYKNIRAFIEGEDGCEVTQDEKRVQTLQRIKNVTQDKRLLPAMFGMVLLAFAVNLIEAICSAGLPAIYTQILALSKLPTWKYYSYIIFYQIIFMLDDMAIFVIAMVTMQAVGVESKYARWVKIFGGLVMLVLGILLIFKPEWLLFG
jgi:cytochrome c biogenesis protein CcdA